MSPPELLAVQVAKSTMLVSEKAASRGLYSVGGTRTGWAGQLFVACIDLLAVATALGLGWLFGFAVGVSTEALTIPLLAAATFLFCSFVSGQTYSTVRRHPVAEFRHTCLSILAAIGIALLTSALTPAGSWSSLLLLALTLSTLYVVIPAIRYIARHLGAHCSWWGRRAIVVGGGERGVRLFQMLIRKKHLGIRPIGLIENLEQLSLGADPATYLGPSSQLERLAAEQQVSLGVLVVEDGDSPHLDLVHEGNLLTDWILVTSPADWPSLWVEPRELGGMPSLVMRNHLLFPAARRLKRALDLVFSIGIGLILLPLYIAIAICVRCASPGPVFYSQERIGMNGHRFRAWKFRSMHANADDVLQDHLAKDATLRAEWERDHKLKNDPRVTWIGRILRKTSLDELPQLWNVLRGEMSLVGPRPIVAAEVLKYGDHYELYEKVPPGITGLWQISGRNNTTYEERVGYDAFYVRNWSPWFDLYILACTVKVVLRGEGAY